MPEQMNQRPEKGQKLELLDRERLSCGLVENVESFTEEEVLLKTALGGLLIKGRNLKLEDLSMESGNIFISGMVDKMEFSRIKEKHSFFKDLFR